MVNMTIESFPKSLTKKMANFIRVLVVLVISGSLKLVNAFKINPKYIK